MTDCACQVLGDFAKRYSVRSQITALAAFLLHFLFVGCTGNVSYQPVIGPAKVGDSLAERVRVIEFDEQGMPFDSEQRKEALRFIKSGSKNPLLIVFIHGWHHNASPGDKDLQSFNWLITEFSKQPAVAKEFDVKGVYIGWRGLAPFQKNADLLQTRYLFSFNSRKAATDRIARMPLKQTLADLSHAAHGQGEGRVIFVGHSFGARILEQAVAEFVAAAGSSGGSIRPPAELTLLLNPAAEARTAYNLKVALQKWPYKESPAIVSVTSEGDTATGNWFPRGMFLETIFGQGYRDIYYDRIKKSVSQLEYERRTAGHSQIVVDRYFRERSDKAAAVTEISESGAIAWNLKHARADQIAAGGKIWEILDVATPGKEYPWSMRAPFHINGSQARGYWVTRVKNEILPGHGGIFTKQAIELFAGIYRVCQPSIEKRTSVTPQLVETAAQTVGPTSGS